VVDPCPISVAGDMMEMVPSVAMLTHGLSDLPAISADGTAADASSSRGSARANVNPAAPIIIRRRERVWRSDMELFELSIVRVMAQASCAARSTARTIR
jgi:hypothetical protein